MPSPSTNGAASSGGTTSSRFSRSGITTALASASQDVKERWFAGCHCDIGGGYADSCGGLWRVALRWMVGEARSAGLCVDEGRLERVRATPSIAGRPWAEPVNESLTWKWWLLELWPKLSYNDRLQRRLPYAGLFRSRRTAGAVLHESVLRRLRANPSYRPVNLPAGLVDEIVATPSITAGMTHTVPA